MRTVNAAAIGPIKRVVGMGNDSIPAARQRNR
jgi:hypothetical protein